MLSILKYSFSMCMQEVTILRTLAHLAHLSDYIQWLLCVVEAEDFFPGFTG